MTAADLRKVIAMLVKKAKAGEPWAVRELLDRTLGKPHQMLELTGMSTMPNVKALPADVIEDIIDARG